MLCCRFRYESVSFDRLGALIRGSPPLSRHNHTQSEVQYGFSAQAEVCPGQKRSFRGSYGDLPFDRTASRQRSRPPAGVETEAALAGAVGCGDVTQAIERRRPRIRGVLGDSLQAEIAALERARSVVDCLAAAMEAGAPGGRGPYYPDVAAKAVAGGG